MLRELASLMGVICAIIGLYSSWKWHTEETVNHRTLLFQRAIIYFAVGILLLLVTR